MFKGSTLIDDAEIRGSFEGDLTVRNRLLIKATGRVPGTIRYGQIEIEWSGQIFRRRPGVAGSRNCSIADITWS